MTDKPTWRALATYVRECQECGHKTWYRPVETYKGDSWKDTKCKKCHSEALDYGSWRHPDACQCLYCIADEA